MEQLKTMLNWCSLFEQNSDQLPESMTVLKDELYDKKVDLDLMLKESISYQNANFSISTIK